MIQRPKESNREGFLRAGPGGSYLPVLDTHGLLDGSRHAEFLVIRPFQQAARGVEPIAVDYEGIGFPLFEYGAEIRAWFQAALDPAWVDEEREAPAGGIPQLFVK